MDIHELPPARTISLRHPDGETITAVEPTVDQIEDLLNSGGIGPTNARALLTGLLATPADDTDPQTHRIKVDSFIRRLTYPQMLEVHNATLATVQGIDLEGLQPAKPDNTPTNSNTQQSAKQ